MLTGDLQMATQTHKGLVDGITYCETAKDYVSRELLETILNDNEEHIDWLETQSTLIVKTGLENYLQAMMSD